MHEISPLSSLSGFPASAQTQDREISWEGSSRVSMDGPPGCPQQQLLDL